MNLTVHLVPSSGQHFCLSKTSTSAIHNHRTLLNCIKTVRRISVSRNGSRSALPASRRPVCWEERVRLCSNSNSANGNLITGDCRISNVLLLAVAQVTSPTGVYSGWIWVATQPPTESRTPEAANRSPPRQVVVPDCAASSWWRTEIGTAQWFVDRRCEASSEAIDPAPCRLFATTEVTISGPCRTDGKTPYAALVAAATCQSQ